MRILVYGAGAVGGFIGGILTAAGAEVTLVARGAHHDAMAQRGLILEGKTSGRPDPIRVRVCRPGEEKPPYDLIVVGLKSHLRRVSVTFPGCLIEPLTRASLSSNGKVTLTLFTPIYSRQRTVGSAS